MTPTDELRTQLRLLLDESIPAGGTDADTLFTDAEIDALLTSSSSLEQAAARGWTLKAQRVMNPSAIVRTQFGSESFTFVDPKDLAAFALDQARIFASSAPGAGGRVLEIRKPWLPGVRSSERGGRCGDEGQERPMATLGDFSRPDWPPSVEP